MSEVSESIRRVFSLPRPRKSKAAVGGALLFLVFNLPAMGQQSATAILSRVVPEYQPDREDPGLPRVLLIGDSISIGYTLPVRRLLQGKANLHRIPINGGSTVWGLQHMDSWLGSTKWDVIHFNWGLHDVMIGADGRNKVPVAGYEANLERLVQRLSATGARLIWASTTPVPEGPVKPLRRNADVVAYNAAAKKVMEKHRIPVNDMYAFAQARLPEIQKAADVHFTGNGSAVLAEAVASALSAILDAPEGLGAPR